MDQTHIPGAPMATIEAVGAPNDAGTSSLRGNGAKMGKRSCSSAVSAGIV